MAVVKIFGKRGSRAVKGIIESTNLTKYTGNSADILVNYGLAGDRMRSFYNKYPMAKKIQILNANIGHSKFNVIEIANKKGILVPESKRSLTINDNLSDWIEKLVNSIGGKGIRKATRKGLQVGRYYQRMIKNRKYEIRVHAFSWMPTKDWRVQKRVGSADTIAWNFSQGGHFINVHNPSSYKTYSEAIMISKNILNILGMSFGAVDFIVDDVGKVYFIEINSAPGFTELSAPIYTKAFKMLTELKTEECTKVL